jgi:mutator protein MutT
VNERDPHADTPVHGVVGILLRANCILLIRRAAHVVAGGAWCLPGGAIEVGETPAAALTRELREELGLEVRPLREVWQSIREEDGLVLHWWLVEPAARNDWTIKPNPDEVAEIRWLTPAEAIALPELLQTNRDFLRQWPT